MTGSCPILFENKQEEYGLTDKEVEKFCQEGCEGMNQPCKQGRAYEAGK